MNQMYATDTEKRREALKFLRMMAAKNGTPIPASLPLDWTSSA